MLSTSPGTGKRMLLASATYGLGTLLVLGLILNWQLTRLAEEQQDVLGGTIAELLAESARQPLVDEDRISLQVVLDKLLSDTSRVAAAAAYDTNGGLLAESRRKGMGRQAVKRYDQGIRMEGAAIGSISVRLPADAMLARYRTPLWLALIPWLLITGGFCGWLVFNADRQGRRLRRLSLQLPGTETSAESGDELDILEQRLAPLLTPSVRNGDGQGHPSALLAIACPGFPRLRAQLNAHHFENIVALLDRYVDSATTLYDGHRQSGDDSTLFLAFSSPEDTDDEAVLMAMSCAAALARLCRDWADTAAVPIDLRFAVTSCDSHSGSSPWLADMTLEENRLRLQDLLRLAGPWDLLTDCVTADPSCPPWEAEPLPSAEGVYRVPTLAEPQKALLDKQVAFLRQQLADPE